MEIGFTFWRFTSVLLVIWILSVRLDCSVISYRDVIVYFPSNCQFVQDSFVCEDVPDSVPENITRVVITAFKGDILYNKFKNTTWRHVKKLNLEGERVTQVHDHTFATLSSLAELTLHLRNVEEFELMAFNGLAKLTKLEMLDMLYIKSQNWLPSLIQSLPGLETFTFNPGVDPFPPTLIFMTDDADSFIIGKKIKSFNVSNTLITTSDMAFLKTIMSPQVDVLNISGSTVVFYYHDDKSPLNDTEFFNSFKKRPILKTLDISRCTYSWFNRQHSRMRLSHTYIFFNRYMTLVENLYADNLFHVAGADLSLNYTNLTDSPVFWKTLSARENNITTVTGNVLINANNTVYSFDLSNNTIVSIQPACLSIRIQLRYINLSNNQLYKMQSNTDFQSLFQMQFELIELDLSYNGISFIPFQMFHANSNLEVLRLSFNHLTTVMFGLTKLRRLRILDLSGNQIQVVEGRYLSQLQRYMAAMQTNSTGVKLALDDNPLLCTCKAVPFVDWLAKLTGFNYSMNSYYCNYEGERQRVDQSAVDKSKYLCRREMIIIVSVSVPTVMFLVISVVAGILIMKHKKRKHMDREYKFREEYNKKEMGDQFMIFMAYASVDEHIVRNHVIAPINETLKATLGTNRDTIATGYKFRPGFRITEETFRLINISHIFVAVVSNDFCRSEYCIGELHEACKLRKPVILVFTGEVDENDMSPYLREVFKRVVRAKLVTEGNGAMEIIPSVDNICESVMMLAMKK